MRYLLASLLVLVAAPPDLARPAFAQDFDIPEGFVAMHDGAGARAPDWMPILTVRPADGPFAELSEIVLARITGAVGDPDGWLARRLTAEVADPAEVEALLSSPDSPFGDPVFDPLRRALPELFDGLRRMGELPLEFCDPPTTGYNASGAFRERFCTFAVGPLRRFVVIRVQQADDRWYYTRITTMNERRLRHLIAIANSFSLAS